MDRNKETFDKNKRNEKSIEKFLETMTD